MIRFLGLIQALCFFLLYVAIGSHSQQLPLNFHPHKLEEVSLVGDLKCIYPRTTASGDKCITVFSTSLIWEDANLACKDRGMQLLEIRTGNDYLSLRRTLEKHALGNDSYWVGIKSYPPHPHYNCQTNTCFYHYVSDFTNHELSQAFWGPYFYEKNILREPVDPRRAGVSLCAFLNGNLFQYHSTDTCQASKSFICEAITPKTSPDQSSGSKPEDIFTDPQTKDCGGEGYIPILGEQQGCYRVSPTGDELSYDNSILACQNQGGRLFKLKNMLQNEFLSTLLDPTTAHGSLELFWVDRQIPSKRSIFSYQHASNTCTSVWIQPLIWSQKNNQVNTVQTLCSLALRYICVKNS